MPQGYANRWRGLGRIEKAFLILAVLYAVLYFSHLVGLPRTLAGLGMFLTGLAALFKLARRGMRNAIWRLRNRLIIAYLFIAVVPLVLLLTLVAAAGWAVIGTMAVYLVDTELGHRENQLLRQADLLARLPLRDPDMAISRFVMTTRNAFPDCELLLSGHDQLRYPPGNTVQQPPGGWKRATGLITKGDGPRKRLYVWAHAIGENGNGNEATIIAPINHEVLATLVPGLGDVSFNHLMGYLNTSHVPPAANLFDMELTGVSPISVPAWDDPQQFTDLVLLVDTRLSAVLGIVFGQKQAPDWGSGVYAAFLAVSILFLVVELCSLVAGISLTRTITGAVHELYQGTQHVKDGDFLYRIPVKGKDQLAELGTSFNSMTENLGRLIVVAKEKERLESELAIAREVHNQLFPKDVPFTKTLELKGVCRPARMVSGDYYDFMSLSDEALAFAIGDVAGKGISAALLMATIQSTMRTQLNARNGGGHSPSTAAMVGILNRQLYATTAPEKYATFYFAVYDEPSRCLTYTNAGHLSPLLLRGGTVQEQDSTGTVVGAFPFAQYAERKVPLEHGDVLVAYTDGIVEPENAYGEMFGDERLKELLLKYERADSSEMIARTMEAVTQWTGSTELQDDMTMVVARRI
jgi:phosphoserine phosphatase RsbU/P